MYKILHIHSNIIFIDHSRRYVDERIHNEIAFIGGNTEENNSKLKNYGIKYKIFSGDSEGLSKVSDYANQFDGVIFHSLNEIHVRVLYGVKPEVKKFLKFFGYELYNLQMEKFLSEKTSEICENNQEQTSLTAIAKRKINIWLNRDFAVKCDNQKKIYRKFDAILIVNKYEYDELCELFYLPKLIERQFVDQVGDAEKCKIIHQKSNTIIIGNNGAEINNHVDILDVIKETPLKEDMSFKLFFNYGNTRKYSYKLKEIAAGMKNVVLIENFLTMEEFGMVYESAAALVINSYRQNALGNIFMGIQVGCKIYLNRKCSTFKWLLAKGFIISEVSELKKDLETGNFTLCIEDQKKNIETFIRSLQDYTVEEFVNNFITVMRK